jgi:hypothetical protein
MGDAAPTVGLLAVRALGTAHSGAVYRGRVFASAGDAVEEQRRRRRRAARRTDGRGRYGSSAYAFAVVSVCRLELRAEEYGCDAFR